jgi:hypothetical protein
MVYFRDESLHREMSTRSTPPRRQLVENSRVDVVTDRSSLASRSGRSNARKPKTSERTWTQTPAGQIVAALICLLALFGAAYQVKSYLQGNTPGDPNLKTYVDSTTGQTFKHRLRSGETVPIISPYTNAPTGYPGFPCYWTKSGDLKQEPTWVILNSLLGKPEPTFCPDCGRLVSPERLPPKPGDRPPPTRDELLHSINSRQ